MAENNNNEQREQQIDWQFPELLSDEGLIEFLKRRYVTLPDPCTLEREKLLDLYHKYVIPLPQRKYRSNRRGREMTKKQILLAKKRKITYSDSEEPSVKKCLSETPPDVPLPRFMVSSNIHNSSTERVEPPKSMINFERKIIRLNSGKEKSSSSESGSNKVTSSPVLESQHVKLKRPSVEIATSSGSATSSGTLKLTNTSSSSVVSAKKETETSVSNSSNGKVNKETANSPKKKIQRISWP